MRIRVDGDNEPNEKKATTAAKCTLNALTSSVVKAWNCKDTPRSKKNASSKDEKLTGH
jgi:hypothetical protein